MPDPEELAINAEPNLHAAPRAARPRSIREFEQALHEAMGFSRREAKAIAAKGFSAIADQPTPQDEQLVDVLAALKRLEERMSQGN